MTGAGKFIDVWPVWLRWSLVLPASLLSYFAVQVAVGLPVWVMESLGNLAPIAVVLGDFLPQGINSVAGPFAFVWVGARMAPSHRFVSAIALATILSLATGVFMLLALQNADLVASRPGGLPWLVATGVVGVGVSIWAAFTWRLDERSVDLSDSVDPQCPIIQDFASRALDASRDRGEEGWRALDAWSEARPGFARAHLNACPRCQAYRAARSGRRPADPR